MIRNDHVDTSVAQSFPKCFLVLALANWRATLEFSGAVGNVFSGKIEIMGTSLNRQRQAELLCGSQGRKRISRRMMNYMNAAAGLAAQTNDQINGFVFGFPRPRPQKSLV